MRSILYKYICESKLSILAYSYKNERRKDDILSKLSFATADSEKSVIRLSKLDQILDDHTKYKFIVIDQSNILDMKKFLRNYRSLKIESNLIITSSIYRSFQHSIDSGINLSCIYMSDLVYNVDTESFIKNRFSL